MRAVIAIFIGILSLGFASAQVTRDSILIYFHQGKQQLDSTYMSNKQALEWIDSNVRQLYRIEVVGSASPEGSVALNEKLSEKRAQTLFDYLSRYGNLPDSLKTVRFVGRDWQGLLRLVKADSEVPYQQESVELLERIVREVESGVKFRIDPFWRLVSFRKGVPYRYMYYHLFPMLRATALHLYYREIPKFLLQELPSPRLVGAQRPDLLLTRAPEPVPYSEPPTQRNFHWALKTNALYDLLLVPNIGVEFSFCKNWSAGANWMYGWWKHDAKHWYWRVYGGDLYARRWFGKQAKQKALTGHHLGVYAQMLTYDFATGDRGYMGGEPGGNLLDKASFATGIEYGYSLPVATRLNLDFSIGVGYMGGQYHEYIPMDDCYVWQTTKKRHWFGPTKAEVSLVWLLDRNLFKIKKGGNR